MHQRALEKYLWLTNNCFEEALRRRFEDDSIFVKTFEVTKATTNRSINYWCDIIKAEINFINSANVPKYKQTSVKFKMKSKFFNNLQASKCCVKNCVL